MGAANGRGQRNPMIVVQGQVYHIVKGGSYAPTKEEIFSSWTVEGHEDAVMYAGSTTGQSHTNEVCSPFAISWHVDKKCYDVSPETFDNLCKYMKEEFDMYADVDGIEDGLGGAANGRGQRNPMIVVQGQVYHIVKGGSYAPTKEEIFSSWTVEGHEDAVMYAGSTTGQSHTNEVCSPFAISWHVDKKCYDVSPETFDNLC